MYKCKYCGKEFESGQKLGGHITKEHSIKENHSVIEKRKRKEIYLQNPRYCLKCGEILPYEKVVKENTKFCNNSCAASYNNKMKGKKKGICKYCGESFVIDKHKEQKFCSIGCNAEYNKEKKINEWLEHPDKFTYEQIRSKSIREYIYNEQEGKCDICGVEPVWNGKPFNFVLDHIDGNSTDNRRENLRLVCPICDSQLPTYKGKNKGNGRYKRMKRYNEGLSF